MARTSGTQSSSYQLRRLVIAVAIVGTMLGAIKEAMRLQRTRQRYLAIAASHLSQELEAERLRKVFIKGIVRRDEEARQSAEAARSTLGDAREAELFQDIAASKAKLAEMFRLRVRHFAALSTYHAQMREKYGRLADCPWFPVAADPPEPEDVQPQRPIMDAP